MKAISRLALVALLGMTILVFITTTCKADPYQDFMNQLTTQIRSEFTPYFNATQQSIDKILVRGQNMQSGAMATSAIDFGYHQGHSIGFGLGTGNTWDSYRAVAGAVGYQYKVDEVSFVGKMWVGDEKVYGVGVGMVIEIN